MALDGVNVFLQTFRLDMEGYIYGNKYFTDYAFWLLPFILLSQFQMISFLGWEWQLFPVNLCTWEEDPDSAGLAEVIMTSAYNLIILIIWDPPTPPRWPGSSPETRDTRCPGTRPWPPSTAGWAMSTVTRVMKLSCLINIALFRSALLRQNSGQTCRDTHPMSVL